MKSNWILAGGLFALSVMALTSCSTSPPQIAQTFWQLNLVRSPHSGTSHEALSLFVQVTDENGLSDLDSIYLLNDTSELYWKLDPSNWQFMNKDGELWVGSNAIEMPDLSPLPRGTYRLLLSNLAGERVNDSIYVSAEHLSASTQTFPRITVTGSAVELGGSVPGSTLWIYDAAGELVGQRSESGRYPLTSLLPPNHRTGQVALTLYAYAYDKRCGCGLLSGPYATAP